MGGITLTKTGRGAGAPHGGDPGPEGGAAAQAPADGAPRPRSGRLRTVLVLAGLALAVLLAALQQLSLTTALPAVAAELPGHAGHPGHVHVSWAVTAYLLTATASLPLHGKLGDLYGRKGMILLALVLFTAGAALSGWARTLDELVAFRAVQGLGAGGILTGAQAVAADLGPLRRRARPLGLLTAVYATGSVAGPLLGAHLATLTTWRWPFHLTVPLSLLALALLATALKPNPAATRSPGAGGQGAVAPQPGAAECGAAPRPRGSQRAGEPQPAIARPRTPQASPAPAAASDLAARRARPDILGALLLTVGISCAVLLVAWGGSQHDWSSRVVLGLACGAVGTVLLYLVVAYWAPEPVIPLRLLRDPVLLASGVAAAVLGVALLGAAVHLPALLQRTAPPGAGALRVGLLLLPLLGALALAGVVSGHVISRTGRHTVPAVTGTAVAVVGMWLLAHLRADTPRLDHSVWQAVLGAGLGMALPALTVAVQSAAPPADLGAATGAHTLFRQLGACAGATVLGTLVAGRATPSPVLTAGHAQAYAEAAPRVLLHLVPVLGLGLLAAFFLKENREEPPVSGPHPTAGAVPPARTSDSVPLPGPTPTDPQPRARLRRPGAPLCGTVRHHDGSHVPGAALTLVDVHGRQTGRTTSGPDGRYALSTPAPGAYVLIASAGGHQPQALTVTVDEPSAGPAERDVVLGGAGRLTGTVTTADGTPVQDASVTLTGGRGDVVATARTGADGGYVLTDLVAGTYTLAAGSSGVRPAALPVSVHPDRETRQDVELAGGALLHGTVRAPGGRPVEEARVTLLDAGGSVVDTLTTGPDGIFRFADLTAGSYTVIASGYPPSAAPLQVAGGGRAERDVHLGHRD